MYLVNMELEDLWDIITLPLIFLCFIDIIDFLLSHYSILKQGIPSLYVDIVFFFVSAPVYVFLAYSVIKKHKGDKEDAAIAGFALSFTKWIIGWIGAVFFYFVIVAGSGMSGLIPTKPFSNPFETFLTLETAMKFGYHVVGATIGTFILGLIIERGTEESQEVAG
jgi:hypothetical protein